MPKASEILDGKVKELKKKEISACYALAVALCYELKDSYDKIGTKENDKWHGQVDNVFRFMMDNFDTEMQVMLAHSALVNYKLQFKASKLQHFSEFNKKVGPYVLAAVNKN